MNKPLNLYKIITLLAIFGIGLALYLLYESFAPAHKSLCYINSTINCEASTKGPLSTLFGIPTPLYGLVGFIFILLGVKQKWPKLITGMAAFGTLFCLRINILEIIWLNAYCPVCLTCQFVMISLLVLGLMQWKQKPSDGGSMTPKP